MALVLNGLRVVEYSTVLASETTLLPNTQFTNKDDERLLFQKMETCEPFEVVQSDASSDGPIVIYFGQYQSTLRTALINHLKNADVTLILFSSENYLWSWFDGNPSVIVASLVLQPADNAQSFIARSFHYDNIHSVLVRCAGTHMLALQRFCRSYARVDGIFDDDTRLLVKLFIDLALFAEELGDQRREDENNEVEAQKNYDRALRLCALVKKM